MILTRAEHDLLEERGIIALSTKQNIEFNCQWEKACRRLLGRKLYIKSRARLVNDKINEICNAIFSEPLFQIENTLTEARDILQDLQTEYRTADESLEEVLKSAITKLKTAIETLANED